MRRQAGYLLLPVLLALLAVAATALLLNRQGAAGVESLRGEAAASQARLVAAAGLEHARWQANQADCSNYGDIQNRPFGPGLFSAQITPSDGSPVSIEAAATLPDGSAAVLRRDRVRVYSSSVPATLLLQPDAAAVDDTYIRAGKNDSNNFGVSPVLGINNASAPQRTLLRFDTSILPPAASLRTLALELWLEGGDFASNATLSAHAITNAGWHEGAENGAPPAAGEYGATFDHRDGYNAWDGGTGGDYDPAVLDSVLVPDLTPRWYQWDLTPLLESGGIEVFETHGVLLHASLGTGDQLRFTSSDGTATERPRIRITYDCECGQTCAAGIGAAAFTLSAAGPAGLGGISFEANDLVEYNPASGGAQFEFDGSSEGLAPNIDAAARLGDGRLLLSTDAAASLAGVAFEPADLVAYDQATGVAELYFDGSRHFADSENVNAATVLRNGNLLLSTDGNAMLAGVGLRDNDVVLYDPVDRRALLLLSGDARGLVENINAVDMMSDGRLLLSTDKAATLGGVGFDAADLLAYDAATDIASVLLDGDVVFFDSGEDVDAVAYGDGGMPLQVLLVVPDPGNLNTRDQQRHDLALAFGFGVMLIGAGEPAAAFEAAAFTADVAWVSSEITDTALGSKLVPARIGVVLEENGLLDEYGFAGSGAVISGSAIEVFDPDHYITEPLPQGVMPLLDDPQSLRELRPPLSPDLAILARNGTAPVLVALNAGTRMQGGGVTAGRRVALPWGSAGFDVTGLEPDGETLLRRALEWAGGTGAASPRRILLPMGDPAAPTPEEIALRALIEGWDFQVIGIAAGASQAQYDDALARSRAAYVPAAVGAAAGPRLRDAGVGVVSGDPSLVDEFGFGGGSGWRRDDRVDITDNTHYIASPWDLGVLDILHAKSDLGILAGVAAPGMASLANNGSLATLLILDAGAATHPAGTAAGRRVQLPWGDNQFMSVNLNDAGREMLRRALEWASGANPAGIACRQDYADNFESQDYTGSTGTLAWTGPWIEFNDDADHTDGDEVIMQRGGDYQARLQDSDGGGEGILRGADLSGAQSATLSFDYERNGFDDATNDYIMVEVRDGSGQPWREIGRISGPGNDNAPLPASYDVGGAPGADAEIRFRTSPGLGGGDSILLNNVRLAVQYCS